MALSQIRNVEVVKHGLFHFLYLCDKVQANKRHIPIIFATGIFSFNFPHIKIVDFPGLCAASEMSCESQKHVYTAWIWTCFCSLQRIVLTLY